MANANLMVLIKNNLNITVDIQDLTALNAANPDATIAARIEEL
jgi:hypothetical protein